MVPGRYVNRRLGFLDGALTALCLAVTAAAYLLYVFQDDLLMSASQASDILAGFEMFRQKSLVLSDWYYSTEVFALRSPMTVAVFAAFTDNMIWAHRLSVVFELAVETLAMVYMLRRLGLEGRPGLLALALFYGARSYQSGLLCGMGFSQDASFYSALFLSLGYLAAKSASVRGKAEKALKFALPAAAFLFGLSSAVMFAVLYFPLLVCAAVRAAGSPGAGGSEGAGGAVEGGSAGAAGSSGAGGPAGAGGAVAGGEGSEGKPERPPARGAFKEVALWNALFLSGYLLLSFLIASRGFGPLLFNSGPSVGFREALTVNVPLLFGQFVDGTPLLSIKGATLIRSWGWVAGWSFLFFAGYAAWMTPGAVRRAEGPAGAALRTLAFSLAAVLVLTTVTLEPGLVSVRYLLYVYAYAALLLALLYRDIERVNGGLARLLLFCIAFTVLTNGMNNITGIGRQIETGQSRASSKHAGQIFKILEENGVSRVYALYWDSYNLEVLGGGRIKAAAVDGRMRPFLRNASISNYSEDVAGERTAFVFSRNPRPWALDSLNLEDASLLDSAEKTIRIEDPDNPVFVCVFSDNPFTFDASAQRAFAAPPKDGDQGIGGLWTAPEGNGQAGGGHGPDGGAEGPGPLGVGEAGEKAGAGGADGSQASGGNGFEERGTSEGAAAGKWPDGGDASRSGQTGGGADSSEGTGGGADSSEGKGGDGGAEPAPPEGPSRRGG